jgi:hypothetical protein
MGGILSLAYARSSILHLNKEPDPRDITARELRVGSRYRYYKRGKLEPCRTLKRKRSFSKKTYSLGWDMGWKDGRLGGAVGAPKDARIFRPCREITTRKKRVS